MRYLAKHAKLLFALLLCSTLAQAQPPSGGTLATSPGSVGAHMAFPIDPTKINIDVPFTIDPVCGVVIIVHSATMPSSFYNGGRNPWGQPAIVPAGDAQDPSWILIFGGSNGLCFPASTFNGLGLHFGFVTPDPLGAFLGSPCWLIGANQTTVPCSGVTGYHPWADHLGLDVLNHAERAFAVQQAAVAFSPTSIPINDLNRVDLKELDWHELSLADNRLPAAEGDHPGTLTLEVPADLQKPGGFVIFSYAVVDPETSELRTVTTLQLAIPE